MTLPHRQSLEDTRRYLFDLRDRLPIFVVTDHPSDYPEHYVARLHVALPHPTATPFTLMDRDLETLQETLQALGLVKLSAATTDDPVILESWI